MLPSATPFKEWYTGPNQFQVLDTLGYQSTELQASRLFVVTHRCEVLHRGTSDLSAIGKVATSQKERALISALKTRRSEVIRLWPFLLHLFTRVYGRQGCRTLAM
jgi:hypothetical protein